MVAGGNEHMNGPGTNIKLLLYALHISVLLTIL